MPHLDATALTEDPAGMEFLSAVIGRPAAEPAHTTTIRVPDEAIDLHGATVKDLARVVPRRTSRAKKSVPEAA